MAHPMSRVKLNSCSSVKAVQMFLSFLSKGMIPLLGGDESPTAAFHVLL
jgi:hypothetical protein